MKYRLLKGYKYELLRFVKVATGLPHAFKIDTQYIVLHDGVLLVRKHYAWDGASGIFTVDTKTFMRGSLVHDCLYQLIREGYLPREIYRRYADKILREICLQDGMNRFRAWYVYKAVRMFGKKSSMPRKNPRGRIVEI
ncbi:hypothetical protein LCGC14_0376250 [marine sediment metagenome]|uniref:DUF1353 domain-containing protein n=1 Tax=marine sediment metagenome TaxID=412755 RepID=A0A0F9TLY6_9ZZZZ